MTRVLSASMLVMVLAACGGGETTSSTTATTATTTVSSDTSAPTQTTSTGATAQTTTTALVPTTTATTLPDIDVIDIDLTAGDDPGRVRVELGRTVRISITADFTDEVHIHGYDFRADVGPGAPAVLEFVADIPGLFEVELEEARRRVVELEVTP